MKELIKCEYCGKEYSKYGIKYHIYVKHTEEGKLFNFKISEKLKTKFKNGELISSQKGKPRTEAEKQKIRNTISINKKTGGYRQGSGRGKSGWYEGYWCDSSYELAYVIYNLEHGIKFERNLEGFDYVFENKICKYLPDFILDDGSFVEIKGRRKFEDLDEKTKCKILQFQKPLKVLYTQDIKIYLDYVIEKYGKDFISLYKDYKKTKSKIEKQKQLILNCNIDFNNINWVDEVSKLINIKPRYVYKFMKTYFIEIFNNCYIKKNIISEIKTKRINLIEERKNLILNSEIDFSKLGWVNKISKIIDLRTQKVNEFMKKHLLEFYENKCFKRK